MKQKRKNLANNFKWAMAKVSKVVHFHTLINYFALATAITQESGFIFLHECAALSPIRQPSSFTYEYAPVL